MPLDVKYAQSSPKAFLPINHNNRRRRVLEGVKGEIDVCDILITPPGVMHTHGICVKGSLGQHPLLL